jgi:hypothetical protein
LGQHQLFAETCIIGGTQAIRVGVDLGNAHYQTFLDHYSGQNWLGKLKSGDTVEALMGIPVLAVGAHDILPTASEIVSYTVQLFKLLLAFGPPPRCQWRHSRGCSSHWDHGPRRPGRQLPRRPREQERAALDPASTLWRTLVAMHLLAAAAGVRLRGRLRLLAAAGGESPATADIPGPDPGAPGRGLITVVVGRAAMVATAAAAALALRRCPVARTLQLAGFLA